MELNKQMEMFEDGGLKDEGGMIDEVSGNDVPSGSTREEVRDDIPAQLSEGEFVFPADVVRFIGLEKLMQMRQKAKMGLQKMEDMGQMGNSEEATMPDDMPFNLDDIDMEDDTNYNRGGVVKAANGTFVQNTNPTQYKPLPEQIAPKQALAPMDINAAKPEIKEGVDKFLNTNTANPYNPQQSYRPSGAQYSPVSYNQFLGDNALGAPETELRKFVHPDGSVRYIPYNIATGLPLYPIDNLLRDGFTLAPEEEEPKKEEPKKEVVKREEPEGGESSDASGEASSSDTGSGVGPGETGSNADEGVDGGGASGADNSSGAGAESGVGGSTAKGGLMDKKKIIMHKVYPNKKKQGGLASRK